MFEPLEEEPDDLFDLASLRRQWETSEVPPERTSEPPYEVSLSPRLQLTRVFQALKETLASSFPERRDTTNLLLEDLEKALASELESGSLGQEESAQEVQPDFSSVTEKINRLEDYLEAIFVESGFWRLRR